MSPAALLALACVVPRGEEEGAARDWRGLRLEDPRLQPQSAEPGPLEELRAGPDWLHQTPHDNTSIPDRGAGLVVEDLNGDGWEDIFLPNLSPCQLMLGSEGLVYLDASEQLPDREVDCDAFGASAEDHDGDGDIDLYIARRGRADSLWVNDGAGHFHDGSEAAGLAPLVQSSTSASWGDLEGDGDLDLFAAAHWDPAEPSYETVGQNQLWENLGDGTFREASHLLGERGGRGAVFIAAWVDLDGDVDQDLYVVHDLGDELVPNVWLRNEGRPGAPRLVEGGEDEGLALAGDLMGLGIGDLNGDSRPDLAISNIDALHILESGERWYYDSAPARGLHMEGGRHVAWAVELLDIDNDADLDLMATFGPTELGLNAGWGDQPDGLWIMDHEGRYRQRSEAWGLDQRGNGRGMVVLDLNADGFLDVVKRDFHGGPATAHLSQAGQQAWLWVQVEGLPPNRRGVGGLVVVEAGGRFQRRWLTSASTSMASAGPIFAHFGLGDAERVDSLELRWPDGTWSRWEDLPVRKRVYISEAEAPR